jgi:hypothetical protein
MYAKTVKSVFLAVVFFSFSIENIAAQADKIPGGGWRVEHYVDEFGDPIAETYYITGPKAGGWFLDIFGGRNEGRVNTIVDGDTLRILFFYRSTVDSRKWLGDRYNLSVKNTATGEVVYRKASYKVDGANLFFRIDYSLKEALHSPNVLQFVVQKPYNDSSPDTVGGFSMTGELPRSLPISKNIQ